MGEDTFALLVILDLKAAVIRAAFSPADNLELNRTYRELASHYQFKIDAAPPRAPKKKGKVERSVRYVKENFFRPGTFASLAEAQDSLSTWLQEVAAVRMHGTTRQRPCEIFETKKSALVCLPREPYEIVRWKEAKVHTDSHVVYERRMYSVPWRFVGARVWNTYQPISLY